SPSAVLHLALSHPSASPSAVLHLALSHPSASPSAVLHLALSHPSASPSAVLHLALSHPSAPLSAVHLLIPSHPLVLPSAVHLPDLSLHPAVFQMPGASAPRPLKPVEVPLPCPPMPASLQACLRRASHPLLQARPPARLSSALEFLPQLVALCLQARLPPILKPSSQTTTPKEPFLVVSQPLAKTANPFSKDHLPTTLPSRKSPVAGSVSMRLGVPTASTPLSRVTFAAAQPKSTRTMSLPILMAATFLPLVIPMKSEVVAVGPLFSRTMTSLRRI
ncbi:hypothetical protein HBI73_221420, partial [Parastagonospora nodorum]